MRRLVSDRIAYAWTESTVLPELDPVIAQITAYVLGVRLVDALRAKPQGILRRSVAVQVRTSRTAGQEVQAMRSTSDAALRGQAALHVCHQGYAGIQRTSTTLSIRAMASRVDRWSSWPLGYPRAPTTAYEATYLAWA